MRTKTILIPLLALAVLAPHAGMAKKPKKGKDDAPPPPVTAPPSACPTQHLETHLVYTGYGSAADPATAIQAAEADAYGKAKRAACADLDGFRCAAVAQHINQWGEPHWDAATTQACFTYGLEKKWLDAMEADAKKLKSDLATLAGEIRARAGERPVRLHPPRWPSGCTAGELGAALTGELRNGLAGSKIAEPDTRESEVVSVSITLASRADGVVLSAASRSPGEKASTALSGFTFAPSLFGTEAEASGDCVWDTQLGLVDGALAGKGGLSVTPWFSKADPLFCEGDTSVLSVATSAPSTVRVFSVTRDGTAYLIWPWDGSSGTVEGSLSFGEQELVRAPGGGAERIVAIAAPKGASMGPSAPWGTFCRLPKPFGAWLYPEGAAVGTLTLEVRPEGHRDCPARPEFRPKIEATEAALAAAPLCGS